MTKSNKLTKAAAFAYARAHSRNYGAWYVREVPEGFATWAHDSGDEKTVAAFSNGARTLTIHQEEVARQNWIDRNGSAEGFDPYAMLG